MSSSQFLKRSFVAPSVSPEPGSPEEKNIFLELQKSIVRQYEEIFPDRHAARTVVILPSFSADADILAKIKGITHYEERTLCLLMLLRMPRTRVIYITSSPVPESIVDYYLHLLPGITPHHARERLWADMQRGAEMELQSLLDGLEGIHLQQAADRVVVVVAAIDDVVDVAAVAAADLRAVLRALRRVRVEAKTDAWHDGREVGELSAVQWELLQAREVDDLTNGRRRGRDDRTLADNRDRLGDWSDSQRVIERGGLRQVDRDVLMFDGGEAR